MRLVFAILLLVACGESSVPPADMGDHCASGETLTFTVELSERHREEAEGGVRGVDLDGRVSDGGDELGCYQQDWVDPVDGEWGVDNQIGTLAVTLEVQPDWLVRPGQLVDLELRVDDRTEDACIEVRVGDGGPVRGELHGGRFRALQAASFDVTEEADDGSGRSTVPLFEVAVEGTLTAEGGLRDVTFGGKLRIEDTVERIRVENPEIDTDLVRTTLEGVADLDPDDDGVCRSVSAAYGAEPVP